MELKYPVGPQAYPDDLVKASPAYRRHAWIAMLALLAFAVFYVSLSGWFVWKAWSLIRASSRSPHDGVWLFLAGAAAAFISVFMLKAVWFVKRGSTGDLTEVTREQQPELFAFIHRLADEARAPRPRKVFLSARVNAAVFYDLTPLNLFFPSRKNLEIGLALVNVLTASEFKAMLAHEFGHFAQRSMAVGRWVYIAQQIAGHVVAKRDALDGFLRGLSGVDVRIAWAGWILSIVVWAIRSVVDTFFRAVLVAERALSREMEFQADRVSVSLTGSDALIHALYRSQAADLAWDRALGFASGEAARGRITADLFEVQSHIIGRLRDILDDPSFCAPQPAPGDPAAHRIFERQEVQVSRMWASHPLNHEREANAKQIYLPVQLDDSPAWGLFHEPAQLRLKLSADLAGKIDPPLPVATHEETMAALELEYGRESYKRLYRGAYLSRTITRCARTVDELYVDAATGVPPDIYPESLPADLKQLEVLQGEAAQLAAMQDGVAKGADGTLRFRGQVIRRAQLSGLAGQVRQEIDAVNERLAAHDGLCRAAARALARGQGGGWESYLRGLLSLVHYAEHMQANLTDAHGALANLVAVTTAGRKVSDEERGRILASAEALHELLQALDTRRADVRVDEATLQRMGGTAWSAMLEEFKLSEPAYANLGDWLGVVDGWMKAFVAPLSRLRRAALDQLLASETRLHAAALAHEALDEAPAAPAVPTPYPAFVIGQERPLQKKLGWWSRFQQADGWLPGGARLLVAGGIIGGLMGMSASVGTASLWIHNGLDRKVITRVGSRDVSLAPGATQSISVEVDESLRVSTRTAEGHEIESFKETPDIIGGQYVYNIALASPVTEWTAAYGSATGSPEREASYGRWFTTSVDAVLTDPPQKIQTKGGGGTRSVLSVPPNASIRATLGMQVRDETRRTLALVHSRWDAPDSAGLLGWLNMASTMPEYSSIISARLADNPADITTLRMEQDQPGGAGRDAVCKRQTQLAAKSPKHADLQYVAVRCLPPGQAREAAFKAGYEKFPDNGWFAYAAGYDQSVLGNWAEASKAFAVALQQPSLAETAAVSLARVRRLDKGEQVELADLVTRSEMLQANRAVETATGVAATDPARVFVELQRGQVSDAVKVWKETGSDDRTLRFLAASAGAPADLVERSLRLPATMGVDDDRFWSAFGLALRHNRDVEPFLARMNAEKDEQSAHVRKFVAIMQTTRDPLQAEAALQGAVPWMRAQAYVVGAIVLGPQAPAAWRAYARKALLAMERPYLG